MKGIWFFATVVLGLLVLVQLNHIADLREDMLFIESYTSSLEEQAKALHQELIAQDERFETITQDLSQVTAERNACMLNIDEPVLAPQKRVNISDIIISEDAAIINAEELVPGIIAPSGSMFPILQENTIVLEHVPRSHNELKPGDIIIFEYKGSRIIHRIVEIGWDKEGWYAITKGDNNPAPDPLRVRFADVRGVVIGIIY